MTTFEAIVVGLLLVLAAFALAIGRTISEAVGHLRDINRKLGR